MLPSGGDALVNSGIMESLLQVLDWKAVQPMNITVCYMYRLTVLSFCYSYSWLLGQ